MHRIVRALAGAAVVVLTAAGGATVHAAQAGPTPSVDQARTAPAAVLPTALAVPGAAPAVDAVVEARDAVAVAVAVAAEAAAAAEAADAETRYTCEPEAAARVVDGFIVNKDCPAIDAAKEAAHKAFAEQTWLDGECVGYGCSPEQDAEINAAEVAAQEEYWARCADTPPGVDGC